MNSSIKYKNYLTITLKIYSSDWISENLGNLPCSFLNFSKTVSFLGFGRVLKSSPKCFLSWILHRRSASFSKLQNQMRSPVRDDLTGIDLPTSNPDNFLVVYSKMVYNIVG